MGKKMLVVSAHAADWCTRSCGTIIKYIHAGWDVSLYVLTYGEHGESGAWWQSHPDGNVEECKACRKLETAAAAESAGIGHVEFFDYGDYPLVLDETRIRDLGHRILKLQPDVILTHWSNDPINMDHEVTSKAVFRAVNIAAMRGALPNTPNHFIPDIFFFETTVPFSEFNDFDINVYVDIGDTVELKFESIKCFESQPMLSKFYRRCAEQRGQQATDWARGRKTITYAEAFHRYTPFLGNNLPLTDI